MNQELFFGLIVNRGIMKTVLIFLLAIFICGCTNSNDAKRALKASGFTDIKMTGYQWFACSQDDFYHTGFIATNAQGKQVKGTVCSGLLFKNATVRF